MSNINESYLEAWSSRAVPTSKLLENAKRLDGLEGEERRRMFITLAKEIEEKYPYKPGMDPDMPGIPVAEVAFSYPATVNIRHAAGNFEDKKDRIKCFELPAYLNIGDIQEEIDSRYRMRLAGRMEIGYCHDDDYSEESYTEHSRLNYYWSYLKQFLDEGKHLRLWYSEDAQELCGFYQLCSILKEYDQEFYAVRLPDSITDEKRGPYKPHWWSQISCDNIVKAVSTARILPKEEIEVYAKEWEKLRRENAPLRAVIDGQLVSVPEEFFDPWILGCIGTEKPTEIGKAHDRLYESIQTIETGWLIHRIDELIRQGKIELVQPHKDVWKQLIRRAKTDQH